MGEENLQEAELESRWEAAPAVLVIIGLQVALAAVSQHEDWTLWWIPWWGWIVLVVPEIILLVPLAWSRPRHQLEQLGKRRMVSLALVAVVSVGNGLALVALIGSLLEGHEKNGAELLYKGITIWTTNMISFGLWYWAFDRGGPVRRREPNPPLPDFQFPQMENPSFAVAGLAAPPARLHLRLVHELDRIQPDGHHAAHAPGEGADARPVGCVGDHGAARRGTRCQHLALNVRRSRGYDGHGPVAQRLEQPAHNRSRAGSNPAGSITTAR